MYSHISRYRDSEPELHVELYFIFFERRQKAGKNKNCYQKLLDPKGYDDNGGDDCQSSKCIQRVRAMAAVLIYGTVHTREQRLRYADRLYVWGKDRVLMAARMSELADEKF